jgi:putative acetyltransferase
MITIESVTTRSSPELLEASRALFRSYGELLRTIGGPALFCFSRLEDEIANVPSTYTESGGEVLLAMDGAVAAGCIAYRSMGSSDPACCEIKRLFVSPAYRGQGLGKFLLSSALVRARQRTYHTACLDTEPRSMATAKQIYLDLGFELDEERNARSDNSLVTYYRKTL